MKNILNHFLNISRVENKCAAIYCIDDLCKCLSYEFYPLLMTFLIK